jgi:hypothetical protein
MIEKSWYPEIMYEENENGSSSKIPFVLVPKEEEMPQLIYVFESRETGEFEPGPEGEPLPMLEMDLHQYADMAILKERLDSETFDMVRVCLGLKPLLEAATAGRKITQNIRENLQEKTD